MTVKLLISMFLHQKCSNFQISYNTGIVNIKKNLVKKNFCKNHLLLEAQ